MALKHWQMSVGEFYRSFSKAAFVKALQRLLPELKEEDVHPGGARALRPSARAKWRWSMTSVSSKASAWCTCSMPSPGATASIAIGKEIVK
ncbi:MAG: hypothetical protein R2932_55675 [Caldilineaceae bacterium]